MKTFNEKDLITWSNREKAVIGNEYYFGNTIDTIQGVIETGAKYRLDSINNHTFVYTFENDRASCYACILPVDAVKEENTYRACRNVKELYELVFNTKSKADTEFYINELVGTIVHFKLKGFDTTYYECITGIVVYINGDIAVHIDGCNFELDELFKKYEIEINGEWKPFGVEA
ncbi:hypothetical protein [Succinivibrio sp.]|uniref:hypothetical protein n=1 Tax=Succinivibrio sp. TaxID=2053619 RepID=UPI00258EE488|nr:hypothetical protein [Succinivibrio sp.]MDD6205805.1 hypothetical protein [Succinivibrio sp.]